MWSKIYWVSFIPVKGKKKWLVKTFLYLLIGPYCVVWLLCVAQRTYFYNILWRGMLSYNLTLSLIDSTSCEVCSVHPHITICLCKDLLGLKVIETIFKWKEVFKIAELNLGSLKVFLKIYRHRLILYLKNYFSVVDFKGKTRLYVNKLFDGIPLSNFPIDKSYHS